jgi:hypothetical protein
MILTRIPGCLDSLVYYKRLLVDLLGTEEGTRLEREGLNGVTLEMLRKLESVDSTRGARYRDLGESHPPLSVCACPILTVVPRSSPCTASSKVKLHSMQ